MSARDKGKAGMSRRRFLQGIGAGATATIVTRGGYLPGQTINGMATDRREKYVQLRRSRIPVLRNVDVLVIGGSVAGVAAARRFASDGLRVAIVEHRNYLGRDIAAVLKPWADLGKSGTSGQVPEPLACCLKKMGVEPRTGEMPLGMDAFKLSLEELLLNAGVQFLYSSVPTEAIVTDGVMRGVVVGNKSGRQALLGKLVIDATSTALVARLAGAEFEPETAADFHFVRMMEMENVAAVDSQTVAVPAELGISGNRLTVHWGYGFEGHILIECPMDMPLGKMDLQGLMQREIEARHRSMRVAAHLIQNVPEFNLAKLAICAYELDGLQTTRLAGPAPQWVTESQSQGLKFNEKNQESVSISLANFAGPAKNLWCVNEAVRGSGRERELLRDPVNAALLGAAIAENLAHRIKNELIESGSVDANGLPMPFFPDHGLEVRIQDSPQRGRGYERVLVPPVEVPILRQADVLVVGGGTSGATCANSAGREGADTVVLELNPGLGGTATLGGVCAYWYGRYWAGFAIRNANLVDEVHKTIHWPVSANTLNGAWNIEAKMYALLKDAEQSRVGVYFHVTTIAAVLEDNQVQGVVAATPYGPAAVLAKVTVDATGDGDVAAFAGARFTFGSERDHYPMWYNLAEYTKPTESRWHFAHTVDVTNVEDYTKAILLSRRGGPKCFDHGNYIATRESRHIVGDVLLTLTDLLRHRQFPDVVNLGAGQMDCHRRITSDWLRMGLLIPILPTEMPYRSLLPQGLENILVVGKATSIAHDVMYNMRNQPETENLGGAAGVAAACAVRDGVSPRRLDLRGVQKRLTEVGTLLPEMLTRDTEEKPYGEAELRALVKRLDGRHFASWGDVPMAREDSPRYREKIPLVEIGTADPRLAVPILEEELAAAAGDRQLRIAQALALFGSKAGVPVLIAAIKKGLADRITNIPMEDAPEAGTVEGQEWGIPFPPAELVYCLGMAKDSRAIPVWDKVADATRAEPGDFKQELPWPFHYADSICYGAELLGDPAAIPILSKMRTHPTLHSQWVKEGFVADFDLDKRALTEITIGRGLAGLGAAEGYEILIEYLDDVRANQAEFAHMTLEQMTGMSFGKDAKAWKLWLANAKGSLKPIPLLDRWQSNEAAERLPASEQFESRSSPWI